MLTIFHLVFGLLTLIQTTDCNIMLNKPSVQSSIYTSGSIFYGPSHGNDGGRGGKPSSTLAEQDPYWQGDLQGFYTVTTITLTSPGTGYLASPMMNAFIGISVHDISCSECGVTICGQWPNQDLSAHTISFNCPQTGPVRFVRMWREVNDHLTVAEVEVEGEPSILPESIYNKIMLNKVTTPTKSLSVVSVTRCGTMCLQTPLCLAFSYSPSEEPNCLLANDVTMTSDVKWFSYGVITCFKVIGCNSSG